MAVWLKVMLLLIYLAVLFIVTRFLETMVWYEQGQISRRLIDPMALSVLRLKAILEQRGVSYNNMVEKTELTDLVDATGAVNDDELEAVSQSLVEEEVQITNYTSDIDFYEQVEDAKDSMWLVEVIADERGLLADTSWFAIRKKVGKFGVRLGRFDCHRYVRLCARKGWFTSRLVLALPENYRSKANVALYTYDGPIRINSLFDWLKTKVNEQVQTIEDEQQLQNNWLSFPSALSPDVRVVFMSTLTSVPLFLSALSVKFPGRVKIGSIYMTSDKGKKVATKLNVKSSPSYIVITNERTYFYGLATGEVMSFKAMEMFLKSVYPSMNDIFILSIVCTNIAASFEISLAKGGVIKRLVKLFLCMFQYNIVLLLVWILILGILQLPLFENLSLIGLKGIRIFTLTPLYSYIRKDILHYSHNATFPLVVMVTLNIVAWFVGHINRDNDDNEDEMEEESDWWNFSNLRTLNYQNGWEMMRLRPFDQIFNPSFRGLNVEDEYQTAVSVNSDEYIKFLPVWVYKESDCSCQCTIQGIMGFDHDKTESKRDNETDDDNQDTEMETGGLKLDKNSINEHLAATFLDSNYRCECKCMQKRRPVSGTNYNPTAQGQDQSSNVWVDRQFHGSSENPWNGQPHYSKHKKVENLNHCVTKPHGYLEDTQCVICLETYKDFVLLRGLPCRHVFHDKCILAWLMRENHFCPVCRWPSFQLKELAVANDLHNE